MKKILLLCLTLCAAVCLFVISCNKTAKIPLSYSVTDTAGNTLPDIYIPDSGTFGFPVWVKFLAGYTQDSVSLSFSGLPADVRVTPGSFSGIPSFIEHFVFYTNHAAHANYQVTLAAYTATVGYTYYKFNLGIIPADCPAAFIGNLSGANACGTAGKYHYTATGVSSPYKNVMYVNNFGGYGTNVNVALQLSCGTDSVFVPNGTYGNNVTMQGQGIFTGNKIIIWYNATSTPSGFPDICVDTLTVAP